MRIAKVNGLIPVKIRISIWNLSSEGGRQKDCAAAGLDPASDMLLRGFWEERCKTEFQMQVGSVGVRSLSRRLDGGDAESETRVSVSCPVVARRWVESARYRSDSCGVVRLWTVRRVTCAVGRAAWAPGADVGMQKKCDFWSGAQGDFRQIGTKRS